MTTSSRHRVRPARTDDVDALLALARQTGGGLTNLPPDRDDLARRVAASMAGDDLTLLVLEDVPAARVIGTAGLFSRLGRTWPFYSYKINRLSQTCKELGKTLTSEVLHLVNDFDGCSEVGGLFVDPAARASGIGRLIARSRYLYMAAHRDRFAARVIADLRGYQAEDGSWPFWEGLGRHFFDMPFEEADRFNGLHGNQFIADLMPKYPIYVRLLPPAAQAALGRPHRDGERALALLAEEGFRQEGYVDIFDAGPTVVAYVDDLKALREQRRAVVAEIGGIPGGRAPALVAAGENQEFRAARGGVLPLAGDQARVTPELAATLSLEPGMEMRHVAF